jgi:hypothetical protein
MSDFRLDKEYQLQKYEGKGGWTYVLIPEIPYGKKNTFGWSVINGFIDDYPLKNYKLMPAGKGISFLPVKAEIRKVIKKEAGDWVRIRLNGDVRENVSELEVLECLDLAGTLVRQNYDKLDEKTKEGYLNKIFNAASEADKVDLINELINFLVKK